MKFEAGMYGISRLQDMSDGEYTFGRLFIEKYWFYVLLQPIISQTLFRKHPQYLPHFYACYSIAFITWNLYWESTFIHLVQFACFYAAGYLRSKVLCYVFMFAMVGHTHYVTGDPFYPLYERRGYFTYHVTLVTMYWSSLRGLSVSMDVVRAAASSEKRHPDFWKCLGYFFYLPSMYLGPVITYNSFIEQVERPKPSWTIKEALICVRDVIIVYFEMIFLNIFLHYFYCSALYRHPKLVERLDNASMAGFGSALVFLYYIKYVILYGGPCAVARMERITLPAPPKCIARAHLCSYFWRYMDRGMHLWLRCYFYEPIRGTERQLFRRILATGVAFGVICVWHGVSPNIRVWSTLNFTGVAIEAVASFIRGKQFYQDFQAKHLKGYRLRVFKGVLGAPLYLLTTLSCIFFLTTVDVGYLFWKKIILGFPFPILLVLLGKYFGSLASMDLMELEKAKRSQ